MRHRVAAIALAAFAAGCGSEGGETTGPAPGATPPRAGEPARPLPPTAAPAPVTARALREAKAGVQPYQAWSAAWAHLTAVAGPPHQQEGELYTWAAREGARCHVLAVRRDPAADRVDMIAYDPLEAGDGGLARCQASAGASAPAGRP
ncbi:MAG TPA: hypothetical protein VKZ63_07845 [Kofleriaceae bacterium]|nr:hypothetical protein [Kofleriaceae bacterium]